MRNMIELALVAFMAMLFVVSTAVAQERFRCAPSLIQPVDKDFGPPDGWSYSRDAVGLKYGLYAAASYDTYVPSQAREIRNFSIADNDPRLRVGNSRFGQTGWNIAKDFQGGRINHEYGLLYDIYTKDHGGNLHVLVAYRGTDSWIGPDGIANFSWVTQWVNPWDQYRAARTQFDAIVDYAIRKANGRRVAFIATGHSLGGGLAQHVAHVHRCVSAVVFDPSPVTNQTLFGNHTPPVLISVYEDNDPLYNIRRFPRGDNAKDKALYRMNGIKSGLNQHSIEGLAAAMLRTAIDCVVNRPCEFKRPAIQEAVLLYCDRYLNRRDMPVDDVCTRAKQL